MNRHSILIALSIVLSFAFGWTACGFTIYSGMFENNAKILEALP